MTDGSRRTDAERASGHAMSLLEAGVPLSLLLDLALPGPASTQIYRREAGEAGWLQPARRAS